MDLVWNTKLWWYWSGIPVYCGLHLVRSTWALVMGVAYVSALVYGTSPAHLLPYMELGSYVMQLVLVHTCISLCKCVSISVSVCT